MSYTRVYAVKTPYLRKVGHECPSTSTGAVHPGREASQIEREREKDTANTLPESTSATGPDGAKELVTLARHRDPLVRLLATELKSSHKALHGGVKLLSLVHEGQRYAVTLKQTDLDHARLRLDNQNRPRLDWWVAVIVPERLIFEQVRQQGFQSVGLGAVYWYVTDAAQPLPTLVVSCANAVGKNRPSPFSSTKSYLGRHAPLSR